MSHCTIHPGENKMVVFTTRRPSTMSIASSSSGQETSSRRPSVADNRRRSSLAKLSLRLTKSNRSRSSTSTASQEISRFGALFFSLPSEIQSLVLSHLPLPTIFSLRLTSRTALALVHANAPDITRSVLSSSSNIPPQHLPYIQSLYPPPTPHTSTNYLLQLLHRHHAIQNVLITVVTYIRMKIYMIRSTPRVEHFGPYRGRLVQRLYPSAWTTYHYLERYRYILVHEHPQHTSATSRADNTPSISADGGEPSKFWHCPTCTTLFEKLVDSYPAERILPAYHFYALLLHHLKASSRAPTYAGTLERKLRGWSRKSPTEEELSTVVILGGMARMAGKNFSVMRGTYNARLEVLGSFVDAVSSKAKLASGIVSPSAAKKSGGVVEVDYCMGGRDVIEEISTPWKYINDAVLDSLPHLDDFLIQDFQRRILEEDLLEGLKGEGDESEIEMERQKELASPFGFVKRLMMEVDEERERRREEEELVAGVEGVAAL